MNKLNKTTLALAVAAGSIASANAAVVFSDSFENPPNTSVTGQTDTAATNWVKANQGFNATQNGLVNEDTLNFSTSFGTQAYHTRFANNSGATTNAGVIGTLTVGQTITVTFNVAADTGATQDWNVGLVTFPALADRNDPRAFDNDTSAVLLNGAGQSGTVDTDDMSEAISFSFLVEAGQAGLGDDIALRIRGVDSSPVYYDNFSVDIVPEPSSTALLGLGGLALILRRRR